MIFKNNDDKLKTRCKISETDKFWDISEITPVRKQNKQDSKSFDTDAALVYDKDTDSIVSSQIKREKIPQNDTLLLDSYDFQDSLIKNVKIYNWPSKYSFYERFSLDARRYFDMSFSEVQPVRYYSYMPSYAQMSQKQREWYFYWRSCIRNKKYLPTDSSYILLYIYEIINLPELIPAEQGIVLLIDIWEKYRKSYTKLDKYMAEWVCDYCLINNIPLPRERMALILPEIIEASIFKQFYLGADNTDRFALLLLEKQSSYRWRKSRYITDENREIFEKHIRNAFCYAVNRIALSDGRFDGQSDRLVVKKTMRDSFGGSLCAYNVKRKIEVEYFDLQNIGDISFIVSDMVKHCENRVRAYLGIRARLGIQNLTEQHKNILNEYFDKFLPAPYYEKTKKKTYEEYVVTEEIKPFEVSFSKAKEIEKASWAVTDKLVDEEVVEEQPAVEQKSIESESLDIARQALLYILEDNTEKFIETANESYMMPETLAECVNELCFEVLGDIGIEERDGKYVVIPEYEQEIRQWLNL